MAYKMNDELRNFDVFPKVFSVGRETEIHVRPHGGRRIFTPNEEYTLVIVALNGGHPDEYPASGDYRTRTVTANSEGGFTFSHAFPSEQEYFLRFLDADGKKLIQFPVYAVDQDLCGRYPFLGDLHMHTNCSDGRETPEVVSANYRRYGYDFFAITDHRRYYPSLQAIEFYKDVPTEFLIVPGEEVHLDEVAGCIVEPHIVNFGGEYSINALVEGVAVEEKGRDAKYRTIRETAPDIMTRDELSEEIKAFAETITVPDGIDRIPAACVKWIYDKIRDADGLGIFPHPNWISDSFHVPEVFTDYLFETRPFDAFEVLGGENYYEHNGFQTLRYYEEAAKGRRVPVVGSTDSHSSYESNRNAFICATIVFSPENERKALISSIKDYYSVAVDTISAEYRLVGEARFVRYACFLLNNYFPLHDELCYEEGRAMKQYAVGTEEEKADALKVLSATCGRIKKLRDKYFVF